MKRKLTLVLSALFLIVVSGFVYYYGYYVKTPNHTLQIIVRAVQNKDVDTFNQHVDVKSITGYWIDDAVSNDPKINKNPTAMALLPIFKNLAQEAIQAQVNKQIAHPAEKETLPVKADSSVNKDLDDLSQSLANIHNRHKNLKIINLRNETLDNGDSSVTLTIKNTKTDKTADYQLFMKPLNDGTWKIYKASPLKILVDLEKD